MRLLFLTSRLPYPPNRGDRYRVFNFLKRLSADHEIELISLIEDESERVNAQRLTAYCRNVHAVPQSRRQSILTVVRNAWRQTPLQVSYYQSGAMRRKVDEVTAEASFDAVYVHLFRMAPYATRLRNIYRIVDLTDVISAEIKLSLPYRGLFSRALHAVEQARIERHERAVAEDCDEAWLISERDRQTLARSCPQANLHVVPNGVNPDQFHTTEDAAEPDSDQNLLLFVGNMSVLHNIDAARYLVNEILPLVHKSLPNVRVKVAGAEPAREVIALDRTPVVSVTGYVDDLNRALNEAAVFVAPLRFAAGVQNKVIDAMAAGRAVVTTGIVNQGIGAVPGRDLLVADEPAALAAHVVALCRDPDRRRNLGAAARLYAREHFQWDLVAERMRMIEASLRSA